MRKVEHGGAWWAQRPDGTWLRWSLLKGDWEPALPPPGLETDAPRPDVQPVQQPTGPVLPVGPPAIPTIPEGRETLGPGLPSVFSLVLETLLTYARLAAPALLLGLLIGILIPLLLMLMFLGGDELMPQENILTIMVFGAVYSVFLTGTVVGWRLLARARGAGDLVTWLVPAVVAVVGAPIAWVVSGDDWLGTTLGRMGTHATFAGIGLGVELYFKGFQLLDREVDRRMRRRWPGLFRGGGWIRVVRRLDDDDPPSLDRGIDIPPEIASEAMGEAMRRRAESEAKGAEALGFRPTPQAGPQAGAQPR